MNQDHPRQAGIILHPTSLPNGVLDNNVYKFIDWMLEANLTVWQMLPLTPPVDGISPYHSDSAFALNSKLLPENWQDNIDQNAFEKYLINPPHWLEDYALFQTLKKHHDNKPWSEWPTKYRFREKNVLEAFTQEHNKDLLEIKKEQFAIHDLWLKIKSYANQKGIQLFGDIPIFVTYNSVDVWANYSQFKLDNNLNPTVVTGVPPDYFSEDGQLWGNPQYNWGAMQKDGFNWWLNRIDNALAYFDILRIDHFRGLEATWEIPSDSDTAKNGEWVRTPGTELLAKLKQAHPNMPFIAEDLGFITNEVKELKDKYHLPGMSVLQFGFDGNADNPHALYNQTENSVVYTGTHDNDTTLGWYHSLDEHTQQTVNNQIHSPEQPMPWSMIHSSLNSSAYLAIIPMQDWLGLDNDARMNTPGTIENNWLWQFQWKDIPSDLSNKIKASIQQANRNQNITNFQQEKTHG